MSKMSKLKLIEALNEKKTFAFEKETAPNIPLMISVWYRCSIPFQV